MDSPLDMLERGQRAIVNRDLYLRAAQNPNTPLIIAQDSLDDAIRQAEELTTVRNNIFRLLVAQGCATEFIQAKRDGASFKPVCDALALGIVQDALDRN